MAGYALFLALMLQPLARAEDTCTGPRADLLILGDSQTGASWAYSYFGNFVQKCLARKGVSFVSYARGGTQPLHWMNSGTGHASLDRIDTVYRSPTDPHLNLGGTSAPMCKKRLDRLIEIHQPTRALLFFGDNLLTASTDEIRRQFRGLIDILQARGINGENCILLTPTYEMAVASKRNVPSKNFENTLKVIRAIQSEAGTACKVLNGLELMKESPLLKGEVLAREPVEGTSGCFGAAANDNIHYCGRAARELADKTCEALTIGN
jgi:hypothetical protein